MTDFKYHVDEFTRSLFMLYDNSVYKIIFTAAKTSGPTKTANPKFAKVCCGISICLEKGKVGLTKINISKIIYKKVIDKFSFIYQKEFTKTLIAVHKLQYVLKNLNIYLDFLVSKNKLILLQRSITTQK